MVKKWLILFFFMFWITEFSLLLPASVNNTGKMIKKLKPLIGNWKTHSHYPDSGMEAYGELKIRWILGGQWMFVEFIGQHPERSVWEAYALIKYDSKKSCYLSYSFFNENNPITMTGSWISSTTVRFKIKTNEGISGIDYTVKEDGTIYQENWLAPAQGERQVLLKTLYRKK